MTKKLTVQLEETLAPTVSSLGYELCDVEFKKEDGNMVLTLFINKDGGVDLDDCEKVSGAVDPILDELDPIAEPYFLSVSSLGLDRPFKKDADYARYLGKPVELKLYAPVDGKKEFSGLLTAFEGGVIEIETDGKRRAFDKKAVALTRPFVEF